MCIHIKVKLWTGRRSDQCVDGSASISQVIFMLNSDAEKVGYFLTTIQKSFRLIFMPVLLRLYFVYLPHI